MWPTKTVQPYSLPDPGIRRRTIDSWIFAAAAICLAAGLSVAAWLLLSDARSSAKVPFDRAAWHVSFDMSRSNCSLDSIAVVDCPPHPENPVLWKSNLRRDSKEFTSRFSSRTGDPFWMGIQIPEGDLKRAAKASASVLVLPRVNGIAQVWLDGVYQTTHDFSTQRAPLLLPIPKSRLKSSEPLTVAIGVFPYPHQPIPEKRTSEEREGFFTALDADRLIKSDVFFATGPHLIAVALFLALAMFLWSAAGASRTRDFALGTQLALLVALTSLLSVDLSFRILDVQSYERFYFSLLLIEIVMIARFTTTIIASVRETSPREALITLASLVLIIALAPPRWIEAEGINLITAILLPLVYGISAGLVTAQIIRFRVKGSLASKIRFEFLVITAISMSATAIAYIIESSGQSGFHVLWSRWLNLILMVALVRVFLRSSHTKSSLIEMSPSSKFHRLDPVPEFVDGWILKVDVLKFSANRKVMSTVLSHLWTISRLRDAEIIRADDRSLLVVFASTPDHSEDRRLLETLGEMSKCAQDLEQRLPILFAASSFPTSILFRAAAVRGKVKPAWQKSETGIARLPVWHDDADLRTMAAVDDLLKSDLDAAFRSNDTSIVVMTSADSEALIRDRLLSPRARLEVDAGEGRVVFAANRLTSKTPSSQTA